MHIKKCINSLIGTKHEKFQNNVTTQCAIEEHRQSDHLPYLDQMYQLSHKHKQTGYGQMSHTHGENVTVSLLLSSAVPDLSLKEISPHYIPRALSQDIVGCNDMPPTNGSSVGAYQWCSHPGSASEEALAMTSLLFWPLFWLYSWPGGSTSSKGFRSSIL